MKNVFATAKVIEPKAPKAKKDDKIEHQIKGLEDYAIVSNLVKNLTTIQKTLGESVKIEMRKIFTKGKSRPDNFRGIDGKAKASCEMRKRSSASPLTDDEVADLERHNLPYDTLEADPERFVINPEYMQDQDLLEKVSAALSKVKGLPEDFIMLQKGSVKRVVSDQTIVKIFECGLAESFIDTVGVLAIKPSMEADDIDSAIVRAKDILKLADEKGTLQ